MKFLVDNQLPLALAVHLRGLGHDCVHVLEVKLELAQDLEIWDAAKPDQRVVVSKDEDFLFLALRPNEVGRLIWVRLGNCRNSALIDAFNQSLAEMVRLIEGGQRIVELR